MYVEQCLCSHYIATSKMYVWNRFQVANFCCTLSFSIKFGENVLYLRCITMIQKFSGSIIMFIFKIERNE